MSRFLKPVPRRTSSAVAVLMLSHMVVAVNAGTAVAEDGLSAFDPPDLPEEEPAEVSPVEGGSSAFTDPSADQVWEPGDSATELPAPAAATFTLADDGSPTTMAPAASRASGEEAEVADSFPVSVSRPPHRPGLVPHAAPSGAVTVDVLDRATARAAGVHGLMFALRPEGTGQVSLDVDYGAFADLYGGGWASRLRLFELPACAATAPSATDCTEPTPVEADQRMAAQTLSTQLDLGAHGPDAPRATTSRVFALASTASSEEGSDYRATDLSPAGSWEAGGNDGAFSYSVPLRVPPASGPTPSLSLGYSSASHDGRTSGRNGQASWIGDGWGYQAGFVERSYKPCHLDEDDSNNPDTTGDMCWDGDGASVTMSLNGTNTTLVRDDASGEWRAQADANWRIEQLGSPADDSASTDERWKVTTPDGTQYFFASEVSSSDSRWIQPVFGNHSGEPCHANDFADSSCEQAYRWMLDTIVDVNGNMVRYFYDTQDGHYGAAGDPDERVSYHRAGHLERIEYGLRADDSSVEPTARVLFETTDRCLDDCGSASDPNEENWPDTPWDLHCDEAPCTSQLSPSFFSAERLASITTQVRDGGDYRDVDSWELEHEFKDYGDDEQVVLWLKSVQHTGHAGDSDVTLPKIEFAGEALPNRVDAAAGVPVMWRWRMSSIKTETGAVISIDYADTECAPGDLPSDAHDNDARCYPVRWTPEFHTDPMNDWFHKHVVSSVVETDTTGGGVAVEKYYDYATAGGGTSTLWAFDDSEFTEDEHRTYGSWRGYPQVTTRLGDPAGDQNVSRTRFYRGMDGEPLPSGGTRSVQLTDDEGTTVTDHEALAGRVWETLQYEDGDLIEGATHEYWTHQTASRDRDHDGGSVDAWVTGRSVERKRQRLTATDWQRSEVRTSYDNEGRVTKVHDLGDVSDPDDDRCERREYTENDSAWIRETVKRVEAVAVDCDTTPSRPDDVLGEKLTFYDGDDTHGATPTAGMPTRVDVLDDWDNGPVYVTESTTEYDALGREVSSSDALDRTTTTEYTPAGPGPVTERTETNPLGHESVVELDPAWGNPVAEVGPNGRRTDLAYDALGRSTAVWLPGRDASAQTPSLEFEYLVRDDAPSAVTTKELNANQDYIVDIQLYDALLRERQTQSETADHGRLVTETIYDTHGRVDEERGPHHNVDPPDTSLVQVDPGDAARRMVYQYDTAGRTVDEIVYNRQTERWRTSTSYGGSADGFMVATSPPDGAPATATLTNARGETIARRTYESNDPTGSYTTLSYEHTPAGELETMTDQAGNEWSWEYDLRGRQVAAHDPDAGTSTMTYDDAGQTISTVDARGEEIVNGYDDLGRQVTRHDGDGTLLAEWEYDTATNGIGELAKATRWHEGEPYVRQNHSYNSQGLVVLQSVTIPASEGELAGRYFSSQRYTASGQVASQGLGKAGDVEKGGLSWYYDHRDDPRRLVFDGVETSTKVLVDEASYSPYGEVLERTLGSPQDRQAWHGFVYEEDTRRLERAKFDRQASITSVADVQYEYDDAGNVLSIADVPAGLPGNHELQCFEYDERRRLVEAWAQDDTSGCASEPDMGVLGGPAPYWHSYDHDDTGNRLEETRRVPGEAVVSREYSYPSAGDSQPHAVQELSEPGEGQVASFDYDQAGNLTGRQNVGGPDQSFDWDAEGRLSAVDGGAVEMVYDAGGQRLIRDDGDEATLFLPMTELTWDKSADTLDGTRYFSHAGQVVAVCTGTDVADWTWMGTDHHGTTTTHAVNAYTAVEQVRRMDPYGNPRGDAPSDWPGQQGFVGGVQDESTGLVHIGARSYDPQLGRFLSVDPILDPSDDQQINGYSYAANNPVTFTDPTGMVYVCAPDGLSLCPDQPATQQPTRSETSRKLPDGPACVEYCGSPADNKIRTHYGQDSNGKGGTTGPSEPGVSEYTYDEVAYIFHGTSYGELDARARDGVEEWVWRFNNPEAARKYDEYMQELAENEPPSLFAELTGIADIERCVGDGDVGSCVWAVAGFTPAKALKFVKVGWKAFRRACSFSGDTKVLMADGSTMPIAEIEPGDQVLATDPDTGETTAQTVEAVWAHEDTLYELQVLAGPQGPSPWARMTVGCSPR